MNLLTLLKSDVEDWNQWRAENRETPCSLAGQDLSHGYFFEADLSQVNLSGVNLQRACLIGADLSGADLSGADLSGAYLGDANLYGANLRNADLTNANLDRADLRRAYLLGTRMAQSDIRTAKLPDPKEDLYADEVAYAIAQRKFAAQPAVQQQNRDYAKTTRKAVRRSLLQQMAEQLQTLTREGSEVAALRQQAIRQSTIPIAKPSKKKNRSEAWGRRQSDRQLSARVGHKLAQAVGRRRIWLGAAAAGLVAVTSVPIGISNLGFQLVSAQATPSFALAQSLTGSSQVWSVVVTQAQGNGGSLVVGGGANGQIDLWDGQSGALMQTLLGHEDGVRTLAISASGEWLVSGSSDGLKVWQLATGLLAYSIPAAQPEALSGIASSSGSPVWSVAISPDEQTFISSDYDGNVTAWALESGDKRYSFNNGSPVWSVAMSPDGRSFVGGSGDSTVRQWDLVSGQMIQEFSGHYGAVRSVAISPDGATLASGSGDETIKLWDLNSGSILGTLRGHGDRIVSLAISPDGQTLASGSTDSTLKLWDVPSRQLTTTLDSQANRATAVAFDPLSQTLVSSGNGQTVKIWQ